MRTPTKFDLAAYHKLFDDAVGPPPSTAHVCGPANWRLYKEREALKAAQAPAERCICGFAPVCDCDLRYRVRP